MSDVLTVRVPGREKEAWQKVAEAVGEDLSEFARKAVRQRVQAVQAKHGSPWGDLLRSVGTDPAPPAELTAVQKVDRSLHAGLPACQPAQLTSSVFPPVAARVDKRLQPNQNLPPRKSVRPGLC